MALPSAEQLARHPLTIVVFGPGFGESIVLRADTEGGAIWGVVDSARWQRRGSSINPALDLLRAEAAHPSVVLLTHPHADHAGGIAEIIEMALPGATIGCIEPLMEPPSPYAPPEDPDDLAAVSRAQAKLAHYAIRAAWDSGQRKWSVVHGASCHLADWTMTVLHPSQIELDDAVARFASGRNVNLNNLSVPLIVERGDVELVLGADGEDVAWAAVADRIHPADLRHTRPIKVPHHGSRDAIQPVLIDVTIRDVRPLVVTPFSRSGTLPRFDPDQGVERLLAAAGAVELTAMPVDLVPAQTAVTLAAAREAMLPEAFEGDTFLQIRPQRPTGTSHLRPGRRDPHESWVMFGVDTDGSIELARGAHAVRIVE